MGDLCEPIGGRGRRSGSPGTWEAGPPAQPIPEVSPLPPGKKYSWVWFTWPWLR